MAVTIQLTEVELGVAEGKNQDGSNLRVLMMRDPVSGLSVQAPLTVSEASKLAANLSGLVVPQVKP